MLQVMHLCHRSGVTHGYSRSLDVEGCPRPHLGSASGVPLPGLVPIPSSEFPACGLNGLPVLSSLLFNHFLRSIPVLGGNGDGDFESGKPVIDLACVLGGVHPVPLFCNRGASGLLQRGLYDLSSHSSASTPPD